MPTITGPAAGASAVAAATAGAGTALPPTRVRCVGLFIHRGVAIRTSPRTPRRSVRGAAATRARHACVELIAAMRTGEENRS
mmetsp:Transcript_2775/g.10638  ORF Transcript_2775/g.10638 Transcript_2775/m.10638 type:complete len:82 (-) Transcript_2775:22-267(-)